MFTGWSGMVAAGEVVAERAPQFACSAGTGAGQKLFLRPAPLSVLDQQLTPKQLSGLLPEIALSVSVMGKVVKRPPPWTVMPGLAVNVLPVTVASVSPWSGTAAPGHRCHEETPRRP